MVQGIRSVSGFWKGLQGPFGTLYILSGDASKRYRNAQNHLKFLWLCLELLSDGARQPRVATEIPYQNNILSYHERPPATPTMIEKGRTCCSHLVVVGPPCASAAPLNDLESQQVHSARV